VVEYIPFITSPTALKLVKSIYSDAEIARVSLDIAERLALPPSLKLWIDPGVDGLHDLDKRRPRPDKSNPDKEKKNPWYDVIKDVSGFEEIGDGAFIDRPDQKIVKKFVKELLDRCVTKKPSWVTVPQLPIVDGSVRNKINRALANATGEWKSANVFSGRLILPLIFTNQNQINGKTQRNPKVAQAARCYHEAHADGYWVVDGSLTDESGSRTLRNTRLPAIIELHNELNQAISSRIRIAGPYWGMSLVLWARGIIDHPAIGIGSSYQYHLAGGPSTTPATRIAIGPLRRRVNVAQLRPWLEKTLKKIGDKHPAYSEIDRIQKRLTLLSDVDLAREQVARFYKHWVDMLSTTPTSGRSLALFQDLSSAYALGRTLPDFPNEGTARRPESVVEPLMLNCV
jgi:hypothetical protein